jgi:hypothetical protein
VNSAARGLCLLSCLLLLAISSAAWSSENRVAKREACRIEARGRIVARGKIEVAEYRRIVERRAAYVNRCIGRSITARSDVPVPPQRVLDDAADDGRRPAAATARRSTSHISGYAGRRKQMTAARQNLKGTLKGKRLKRLKPSFRRSK